MQKTNNPHGSRGRAESLDRVGAGMRRWEREFPAIDCSGKAIVGRILHLQEVFLSAINEALAPFELKYPEFAVLATLRVEGAPYRMSPKALLDTLILTSGGLSNLLRKLEDKGFVRRSDDAFDRRGVVVELTPLGRRAVEPAMHIHADTERRLSRALGVQEVRLTAVVLSKLMASNSTDGNVGKSSNGNDSIQHKSRPRQSE